MRELDDRPGSHMTDNITQTLARLQSQVEWWRDQADQVGRDRANLRFVPPIGLIAGAIGYYIKPLLGGGLLVLTLVVWGMGMYMTTVRRSEFRENLREAEADLHDVEAAVAAQRTSAETTGS